MRYVLGNDLPERVLVEHKTPLRNTYALICNCGICLHHTIENERHRSRCPIRDGLTQAVKLRDTLAPTSLLYIYSYIYLCVCVCVCARTGT